jgi:hypothetical protein
MMLKETEEVNFLAPLSSRSSMSPELLFQETWSGSGKFSRSVRVREALGLGEDSKVYKDVADIIK